MKVVASGRKTHMFDAHLSVLYLDFLRTVFRQRRLELATELGESMDNLGGALLWDAFAGNKQSALRCLRTQWSKDMRVTIVGPDSETPVPGGFSADGQPNDAWHQFLSSIKSAAERAALRVFRDPLKRDTLTQMPHSANGHTDGNVSLLTSLKAQLFAQVSVPTLGAVVGVEVSLAHHGRRAGCIAGGRIGPARGEHCGEVPLR